MPRVPLESTRPIAWFATLRVAIIAVALIALAVFDVPHRDRLIVVAAVAAPIALWNLYLAQRAPALALHPGFAMLDLTFLAVAELVAPTSYAGVRFLALFLIAAHAHFQGEQRGLALAAVGVVLLMPIAVATDVPVSNGTLGFYETLFATSALASGLFMGRLRTAESAGRLRARELSRRIIEAEARLRRRLAENIHDGPVQDLVSLDLMLDAARRALERGDSARVQEMLEEARTTTERNIGSLREEIISLGPYAIDEMSVDSAIEQCAPVWSKRYGLKIDLDLARMDLPNDLCGALFGVAQEAVANAGRHAGADSVRVTLHNGSEAVELTVRDDGHGFAPDEPPFATDQPGHIGLATMRERTELAGGTLAIDTGPEGTTVRARVPASQSGANTSF